MLKKFDGIKISALQGILPSVSVDANAHLVAEGVDIEYLPKLSKSLGFKHCRVLPQAYSFADMMIAALKEFISQNKIELDSIDQLFSVTQSPNYMLPGNSFLYHKALGLSPACGCLDILGACSGVLIALHQAVALIKAGSCQRILIVGGDHMLYSKLVFFDGSNHAFADAGCILLVEADELQNESLINAQTSTAKLESSSKSDLASESVSAVKAASKLDFTMYFKFETLSDLYDKYTSIGFSSDPKLHPQVFQPASRIREQQLPTQNPLISDASYASSATLQSVTSDSSAKSAEPYVARDALASIKVTRTIQEQTLENLRQLLQSSHLKLSDLGCGVLQQNSLIITQQMNLYLNRLIGAHLHNNLDPEFACFDVKRPEFFPFVSEEIGHVACSSLFLSLSAAHERLPNCQSKPIFVSTFGAGMSIYSALLDLRKTMILPPFYYQVE